jgi:hypothetical protein
MAAKCRHLFSVLTSGPVTVGAQRGTCGGPEVTKQRCMHRFVWMCIGFVLPTVTGPEVKTENRCRHLAAITHTSTFMQIITSLYLSEEAN